MKIIGHRGAAGLALENTKESIQAALKTGVDAIEFDIRVTKDQQLVINHDKSLLRTFRKDLVIAEHTLAELRKAAPRLMTFHELLELTGKTPLVIELKEVTPAKLLKPELAKIKHDLYSIVSFKIEALQSIQKDFPDVHMSLLSFAWPCLREHQAHKAGLQGVGVFWLFLNPLVYWQTKRHGLEIYTYTVNHPWLAKFLHTLYPRLKICTDRPDRLQFLRP